MAAPWGTTAAAAIFGGHVGGDSGGKIVDPESYETLATAAYRSLFRELGIQDGWGGATPSTLSELRDGSVELGASGRPAV